MFIRDNLATLYTDVYTPEVLTALAALSHYNEEIKSLMSLRMSRRSKRQQEKERIQFLAANELIPGAEIKVQDARDGKFIGSVIPPDLQRQWIQGTGPAAKANLPLDRSLRNIAHALLSGADGWMFDGEDALGQTNALSLDNQRNLKLAIHKDSLFLKVAQEVAEEMNIWAESFFGFPIINDFKTQLDFTTKIFRARGLHLDDRHIRDSHRKAFSASIVDLVLYVVNNYKALIDTDSSIILYLPKIQTAEEAALWNKIISQLEHNLFLTEGTIKVYVLIEQLEATYQLMEIRAVLGKHFIGFNTGRWDYINSVSDAMSWDPSFINPNIESITMTYSYMQTYEDRVRRAVNTPDLRGHYALWQGGMEPNIPVGSEEGVSIGMRKAIAGAEREQSEGASGKWVAHWKMVNIIRPVWERIGTDNHAGRLFPALTYTQEDADKLIKLEPAPITIRGARNLISIALQYGNAFLQGMQAVALKPADFFEEDDILYLMEDMATGEIRLSILWEWLHKKAKLTEEDENLDILVNDIFDQKLFQTLFDEEYLKLINASPKIVHQDSKTSTLPISKAICQAYVLNNQKFPWFIDLLNINLNNTDYNLALKRIEYYLTKFQNDNQRITENIDTII